MDKIDIDFSHLLVEDTMITPDMNYHIRSLKRFLRYLQPQYCMVNITTQGRTLENPDIDEFYGTKYKLYSHPIAKYVTSKLKSYLPVDHGLITEDLLRMPVRSGGTVEKYDSEHTIYIDTENPFKNDKVRISVEITPYSIRANPTPQTIVFMMLYMAYINIHYNHIIYDLGSSFCHVNIDSKGGRIDLYIECFSTMVEKCLDMVFGWLKSTVTNNSLLMDKIVEMIYNGLENNLKKGPYEQLNYDIIYTVLKKYNFRPEILIDTMIDMVLDKPGILTVGNTVRKILQETKIDCLISGNVDSKMGHALAHKVDSFSRYREVSLVDWTVIPQSGSLILRKNKKSDDPNSACAVLYILGDNEYQKGTWDTDMCLMLILENIIKTIYFNELRTKQKLAYIAKTHLVNINLTGHMMKQVLKVALQSGKINAAEIANKSIDVIKNQVANEVNNMTVEKFSDLCSGVRADMELKISNIEERDSYLQKCITHYSNLDSTINYHYKNELMAALDKLKIDDLKQYFHKKFIDNPMIFSIGIDPR